MPKLAIAVLLLALAALASTLSYAGFLVVGIVSDHLGTGRFAAGLLLAALFARIPWVRQGKLRTAGLLPGSARRPVIIALLAFCLLSFAYRGEMVPALFLGLAAGFLVTYPWMRKKLVKRALSSLFGSSAGSSSAPGADKTVIDAEFRERKD